MLRIRCIVGNTCFPNSSAGLADCPPIVEHAKLLAAACIFEACLKGMLEDCLRSCLSINYNNYTSSYYQLHPCSNSQHRLRLASEVSCLWHAECRMSSRIRHVSMIVRQIRQTAHHAKLLAAAFTFEACLRGMLEDSHLGHVCLSTTTTTTNYYQLLPINIA
jgi:hypothetical protein